MEFLSIPFRLNHEEYDSLRYCSEETAKMTYMDMFVVNLFI